ncbi:hypothetical protein C8J56DRAFT_1042276 [Mycena floridula]|nr:hypothetical protein C8J56DRAFT_1042276 [Mycena floridula]
MSTETYELLYFPLYHRVDASLMALEITDTQYKMDTVVEGTWPLIKAEQQFGHVPRLTVTYADGTSKMIWESLAIELYLGEKLGLLPIDCIEKAQSISIITSLHFLRDTVSLTDRLPPEIRAAMHDKHISDTIPNCLKWHEALLEKSSGTHYAGNSIMLPDLILATLYLRYRDMYGDRNPVTKFPKTMKAVETILSGTVADYVNQRRDHRVWKWDEQRLELVNEARERSKLCQ